MEGIYGVTEMYRNCPFNYRYTFWYLLPIDN